MIKRPCIHSKFFSFFEKKKKSFTWQKLGNLGRFQDCRILASMYKNDHPHKVTSKFHKVKENFTSAPVKMGLSFGIAFSHHLISNVRPVLNDM